MQPTELFLSYSSLDYAFANSVADVLHRHAIPVWSQTNIVGGMRWHDEIGAALRRCDWFAVILSPNAVDSMWVRKELVFASHKTRFYDKILPLLTTHVACFNGRRIILHAGLRYARIVT